MKIQNLINKVGLHLGQEKTDQICESQDDMIEHIPMKHYLSVPSNLKDARKDRHWESCENAPVEQKWYQSIIGSLNYLALGTRPNLSFAVGYLARYAGSPQEEHWGALKHLLACEALDLWSDADWGGEFQRSTSGFILRLFNCTIAWGSRRQKVVASSTCVAELMAMGMAMDILTFMIQLVRACLKNIQINIHCDNRAAILILEGFRTRIKSLERNFYIINDLIRKYVITLKWTTTLSQLADICTKQLGPAKNQQLLMKLMDDAEIEGECRNSSRQSQPGKKDVEHSRKPQAGSCN
ncbi:hypothetical protein O181_026371 [Austropuccinia psidii MF-1]|uniref:Reverse transcriptase Ty1/copia-type domain-containing protein n=1 Tax=Austropuccinia psidii MF-1 TaxID=1389203 RepID=A0A9Q3H0F6_9BASI|nr:hypothetical protein [Austropuccinia psidii MF-1]